MGLALSLELARAEDSGDPHAFREGLQEYLVRWEGGEYEAFSLRWDEALQTELAGLREASAAAAQALGRRLRGLLTQARWQVQEAAIVAALRRGETVEVQVSSAAAELYALPWELLTLPSGEHLGELPGVRLRYRWPGVARATLDPATRREGGEIVFAWSDAFGAIGEQHFVDAIAGANPEGPSPLDPTRDVLAKVTWEALLAALERRCEAAARGEAPPAILHLHCHGAPTGSGYGLGIEGPRGTREVIDAGRVRTLAPFARLVRLVVLTACDAGNPGAPGSALGSVGQALHRVGFESVIAARAPLGGAAALTFTTTFYRALLGSLASVEEAFAAARTRVRGAHAGLDWASLHLLSALDAGEQARPRVVRPYRGLLAFEAAHRRFFFGREPERDEALSDLDALVAGGKPRALIVTGASGTGKSSVVRAGVVPALVARGWQIEILRPGRDPQAALAAALQRRGPGKLLLVVDQFEEVFTAGIDAAGAEAFVRHLWRLASEKDGATAVLLALRVDYLGRCGELRVDEAGLRLDRVAYDEAHRVFVAQIDRSRLPAIIEGPWRQSEAYGRWSRRRKRARATARTSSPSPSAPTARGWRRRASTARWSCGRSDPRARRGRRGSFDSSGPNQRRCGSAGAARRCWRSPIARRRR